MPPSHGVPNPPPLASNGIGTHQATKESSPALSSAKTPGEKITLAARLDSLRSGRFRQASVTPSGLDIVSAQEHSQLKIKLHNLESQLKIEVEARGRLSAEYAKKLKELQAECDAEREKLQQLHQEIDEACDIINELEKENKRRVDAEKFNVELEKLLTELYQQAEKILVLEECIEKYKLDEQRNDALLKANRQMEERLNKATDECERLRTELGHENILLSTRVKELVDNNASLVKAEEEMRDREEKSKLSLTIEKQKVKSLELEKESLLQENKTLATNLEASEEEFLKL
jgi:chromosome segregation ATPase